MVYKFTDIVIDSRTGLNPRKNFVLGNGGNYYITIKDIYADSIHFTDKTDRVDDEAIEIIKRRSRIKVGDVLFVSIGRIGETAIVTSKDDSWDVNESVFVFTLNNAIITPEYFCLLFRSHSVRRYLAGNSSGSTFKSIKMNQLERMTFDLPAIEEQKAITAKIYSTRTIIGLRQQQLTELDNLVKARFVEMFGDCRTNPKGWNTKHLEEVAEVGSSKRVFVEDLKESGVPFYRGTEIGALAEGKNITPELFITPEHYRELCQATGRPQIGDLLMPSICPDGRIWVVNSNAPFYFKDGRVLWVHNITKSFNPTFLLYTLKDRIMTDYLSIASGTTFAELKIFALKQSQVFDAPMELQNQFARFIEQTDKSKLSIRKSLDQLETLKNALMQKYFG